MFLITPLSNGKFRLLDDGLVYGDYDTLQDARDDKARLELDEKISDDIHDELVELEKRVAAKWSITPQEVRVRIHGLG